MNSDWLLHESFDSATEFIGALHPRDKRWGPTPENWIFRGHANASWRLIPSAFRDSSWKPWGNATPADLTDEQRATFELVLLRDFGEILDREGLHVPANLENVRALQASESRSRQWPREVLELAALAQHHGVPTRLLDFTRHAYVAAYFACDKPTDDATDLCVWAVDQDFLALGNHATGLWFQLARVPRSTNPNLHAQAGMFALWTGPDDLLALDEIAVGIFSGSLSVNKELPQRRPVFWKLTLPRKHVGELFDLLRYERITGASMFPGVDGVVRELKEANKYILDDET